MSLEDLFRDEDVLDNARLFYTLYENELTKDKYHLYTNHFFKLLLAMFHS
jgi:hypothetical protein